MCAIMTWGAHEYFMHPIFVLKNGCDITGTIPMMPTKSSFIPSKLEIWNVQQFFHLSFKQKPIRSGTVLTCKPANVTYLFLSDNQLSGPLPNLPRRLEG
jgi:hypothetical protein